MAAIDYHIALETNKNTSRVWFDGIKDKIERIWCRNGGSLGYQSAINGRVDINVRVPDRDQMFDGLDNFIIKATVYLNDDYELTGIGDDVYQQMLKHVNNIVTAVNKISPTGERMFKVYDDILDTTFLDGCMEKASTPGL